VAFAEHIGFSLSRKAALLRDLVVAGPKGPYAVRRTAHLLERSNDGVELTYNLCEPRNHSYIVNGVVVRNCSEYLHLDNSACNLSSINLLKFLTEDGGFDVAGFKAAVRLMFTAQEILVGNADYPTGPIAENSRRFRELGLGYANLGALLMANGLPYDSGEGRAWAGAITALMTGHAYVTSARTAARMGPFAGYYENAEPMIRVLRKHQAAAAEIDEELVPPDLLSAAQQAWDEAVELAEEHGVRNSQASVLAPTGCLVGGTMVSTGRGLVRLRSLGDPDGERWQELDTEVATDEDPQRATRFFVNGAEPVVTVSMARGFQIKGTTTHRVKVVDAGTATWEWRRFADLQPGDLVPLALDTMVGEPRQVPLPPLPEAYWTGEHDVRVPRQMNAALAELIGYFMGDGSLHSRGLRFCVTTADFDVVEELERLGKECFGIAARTTPKRGYVEVGFNSVRLALWWEACGFAKFPPTEGHRGKGYTAHIPDAVLHANSRPVYAAFLRGLFEADGDPSAGYPTLRNTSVQMVRDAQVLHLALGIPMTLGIDKRSGSSWGTEPLARLRTLNTSHNRHWLAEIGFMGGRKGAAVRVVDAQQAGRNDHIPLSRELIDRLAQKPGRLRRVLLAEARRGAVSRRVASELYEQTHDEELGRLLSFFYDRVASAELGDDELTYDLSVPSNVTYVANGFVSHNTIGLLMDCDTTGVEPDLGLVKMKKLVGGGTMSIVNQTVPRALRRLGYSPEAIDAIVTHIDEHKTIVGAPGLLPEHLPVFACSMGDNTIHYSGHVRMMGAVQPFISGGISKCVTGETLVSTDDGLVRIGTLFEGEAPDTFRAERMVLASLDGIQKTDAFYYGGERPVRRVALRSGHAVTGTPNHRLLVAGENGLDWKRLDEIAPGDEVAIHYGADLWSMVPAHLAVAPAPERGDRHACMPTQMTEDLAFLLGAYAATGHTSFSTWSVRIAYPDRGVLEQIAEAAEEIFGVPAALGVGFDGIGHVDLRSKRIAGFFDQLGCGQRGAAKRVPDAVLRSPKAHVLAYLRGLSTAAQLTASGPSTRWSLALDSSKLVDDVQAVLTNLGIVHGRIAKGDARHGTSFEELYALGDQALELVRLVPFVEAAKAQTAQRLFALPAGKDCHDLVPGIAAADLYRFIPDEWRGRFAFLLDPSMERVSWRTLGRVALIDGVTLPPWLRTVVSDGLHFSPVVECADAGVTEVYDLSVPTTHAFVGNGIVNHNTVNMPETVTVEDVEQLHVDAWKLGIKAVAIYRDNCKVAQPLSTAKKDGAASTTLAPGGDAAPAGSEAEARDRMMAGRIAELESALEYERLRSAEPVVVGAVRERLPRRRRSKTFAFRVADCEGYVTVGEYEDGRPGEVFIKVSKQGSTLAGIMDAFSIAVSLGLQHGVPLATYVNKYSNMKFEPAGITDDEELRIASSLVDYIFRRIALDYLPYEERLDLGVLSTHERTQPTLPGVEEVATLTVGLPEEYLGAIPDPEVSETLGRPEQLDAPYCYSCGNVMQRAGSCYVCPSCGSTSGCS
jgi:intein/homing endonuclease